MSFSQVKELRRAGNLSEALIIAREDLDRYPDEIWNKRSMAWVLNDYIKQYAKSDQFTLFEENINTLLALELPDEEMMVFNSVAWQVVKIGFDLSRETPVDLLKINKLFEIIQKLPVTKPSEPYSAVFKAFYKAHKEWPGFPEFVEWWDLGNFRSEDYLKEKLPDGKEIISLAERGYIGLAKCLLEKLNNTLPDEKGRALESLRAFLPLLDKLIDDHPEYLYPPYFKAKILLALGDEQNVLSAFLPFARSKATEFWVWDLMSEIFHNDDEKQIACLTKALTCKTPPDFLIKVRFKLAGILVRRNNYTVAKTEIKEIIAVRESNNWPIPGQVTQWTGAAWYNEVQGSNDNQIFYHQYLPAAEEILFGEIPEEIAVVEFVNRDKKILNFIINKEKTGFFRYANYLQKVEVGDRLLVRLEGKGKDAHYNVLTLKPTSQPATDEIIKDFKGELQILEGQAFGFVDNIFIDPDTVKKLRLSNGQQINGQAMLSFNKKKNEWGWKGILN